MTSMIHLLLATLLFLDPPAPGAPNPTVAKSLDGITDASLRESLEFLASDALEGRGTPSRGLDAAAQFIAEQFADAGLVSPPGAKDFFQEARWNTGEFDPASSAIEVSLTGEGKGLIEGADFVARLPLVLETIENAPFLIVSGAIPKAAAVRGRVVVLIDKDVAAKTGEFARLGPRAILTSTKPPESGRGERMRIRCPIAYVAAEKLAAAFPAAASGFVTMRLGSTASASVRNVCGLLEGGALKDEVVMVTAHYDHLGKGKPVKDDAIYNGADDDASGVAAMIATARALGAAAKDGVRPKRSVLCVAFFGEEVGLIGSSHYAQHPLIPPERTIANLNIEMVGRPDDIAKNEAWVTGFPLSTLGAQLADAGRAVGVRFYERPQLSAMLFPQSDNLPLARVGIPAHSISAGSLHKDYHQPSDEIDTLDYANMAAVTRGIAWATFAVADGETAPKWTTEGEDAGYTRERD